MFFRNLLLGMVTATLILAVTSAPAKAWNCVQFVHQVSSFQLSGDAWQWWRAAIGHYDRGRLPETSAVLVFDRSERMRHGHVALVSKVIDRRTIEIDHANWSIGSYGRGKITRNVRVVDVSERNDWTSVRVWNDVDDCWGRPYKTMGFIYAN